MTIFEIETFTQRTGCLSFKIETTSVADPGLQMRGRLSHQDPDITRGVSKKNFFRPIGPQFDLTIRGGSATALSSLISCHNGGISLDF